MAVRKAKGIDTKPIIPYEDRVKWAMGTLGDTLEKILVEFDDTEKDAIQLGLAKYAVGYLGVSYGLSISH